MNARFRIAVLILAATRVASAQAPAPPATPSSAAAIEEGRRHFNQALALYKEGDFRGALVEFDRANKVAPNYRILYNVGQTYYELQDYAGALGAFERYRDEGGDQVAPSRRAQVDTDIKNLQQRVARLEISTNVPGVELAIDGITVGTTPLVAPIVVSVGMRTVTATLPGRAPITKTVELASGDRTKVAFDLAPLEAVAPPVPAPPVPAPVAPLPVPSPALPAAEHPAARQASASLPASFWIGVAGTGALAVGATTMGVLALSANHSYQTALGTFPGSPTTIASDRSRVHAFALASDILTGTAIVAAGVTIYLGVSRRKDANLTAITAITLAPRGAGLAASF